MLSGLMKHDDLSILKINMYVGKSTLVIIYNIRRYINFGFRLLGIQN